MGAVNHIIGWVLFVKGYVKKGITLRIGEDQSACVKILLTLAKGSLTTFVLCLS